MFDRFEGTATVHRLSRGKEISKVYSRRQTVKTPFLPGFKVSLSKLFQYADRWERE